MTIPKLHPLIQQHLIFQALYAKDMKKIKITTTIAISFASLLIFYILNILVLFFLLNIARVISKSYTKIAKNNQDAYTTTYIQEKSWEKSWESPEPSWSLSCETAHFEYDLCYLNHPTTVNPTNAIVSTMDPTKTTPQYTTWVRPYPRKGHIDPMRRTKEVTLTTSPPNEPCTIIHHSPILIFSTGGFTGNTFHDFNEGWVPLFVTIHEFFEDRDVILGIYDCKDWWLDRYAELLPLFTRHPIINLDRERKVHCFPYGIVGLKSHGVMEIDPALFGSNPKTMLDFHSMLGQAYKPGLENAGSVLSVFSSGHEKAGKILSAFSSDGAKPRLAFMVRKNTRKIINGEDVIRLAEELGFEVIVFEVTKSTPMREIYRLINSGHAFMSVHGSGLTHLFFLRPGAVLIQIIPINCGWLADMCYGRVTLRLGIQYIAYEIGFNESSLKTDDFAKKAILDRLNPASSMMGHIEYWDKYMNQDIEIDVVRFKRYLKKTYEKARKFMQKQGLFAESCL